MCWETSFWIFNLLSTIFGTTRARGFQIWYLALKHSTNQFALNIRKLWTRVTRFNPYGFLLLFSNGSLGFLLCFTVELCDGWRELLFENPIFEFRWVFSWYLKSIPEFSRPHDPESLRLWVPTSPVPASPSHSSTKPYKTVIIVLSDTFCYDWLSLVAVMWPRCVIFWGYVQVLSLWSKFSENSFVYWCLLFISRYQENSKIKLYNSQFRHGTHYTFLRIKYW